MLLYTHSVNSAEVINLQQGKIPRGEEMEVIEQQPSNQELSKNYSVQTTPIAETYKPFPRFKNRDRIVIISNLLDAAKLPALKTSLMYRTQLSYSMLSKYLELSLDKGLVKTIHLSDDTKFYKTTDSGLKFLEQFHSLIELFTSPNVAYKKPFLGSYDFLSLTALHDL